MFYIIDKIIDKIERAIKYNEVKSRKIKENQGKSRKIKENQGKSNKK